MTEGKECEVLTKLLPTDFLQKLSGSLIKTVNKCDWRCFVSLDFANRFTERKVK